MVPAEADVSELIGQMDTTTAKYATDSCIAARQRAGNYDEHVAARFAGGYALGYAFGVFGVFMAAGVDAQQAKMRRAMLNDLIAGCGSETFLPYVKSKSLENSAEVQRWLGFGYAQEQEWPEAIDWYRKAADQKYPEAETELGALYFEGTGVPVDYAQAIDLWQQASDEHYPPAQSRLARAYIDGKGVAPDVDKGTGLYRSAASQGDADAQYHLAMLYESGVGVSGNLIAAYRWYAIAGMNGNADAEAKRKVIASQLSQDAMQTQNAAVLRCKAQNFLHCQ